MNNLEKNTDAFTIDYVSDVVKGYSAIHRKGKRYWKINHERVRRIDWLLRIIKPDKEENILEIGCGFGPILFRYAGKTIGGKLIGVDVALETLRPTIKFFERKNLLQRVEFCLAKGQNLPFKSNTFNKILLIDVLEHMDDFSKKIVILESFRVLKDDGVLLINTPNIIYLNLAMKIKRLIYRLTFRDPSFIDIPQTPQSREKGEHVGLTNTFFLKRLLTSCGFFNIKFIYKPDNIYGLIFLPFCLCVSLFKETLAQSITLICKK